MKRVRYDVSDETNDKYIQFINLIKSECAIFQSSSLFDKVLKIVTHRLGGKLQIKMGSRFLYKSFNRSYFFKNLYKNMIVIEYLSAITDISNSSISFTINDIGCGLAPSTIAYELMFDHREKMHFNLKDNSTYQMHVAKEMLKHRGILHAALDTSALSKNDISSLKGLTFFSYFLCEQPLKELVSMKDSLLHATGHIICIDYEKNIKLVEQFLSGYPCVHRFKLHVRLHQDIKLILNTEDLIVNGLYFYAKGTG